MSKIENFIKKWNGKIIEDWGCYCSDEFKSLTRSFRSALKSDLGDEYELIGFKANHYDFSGFVKKDNHYVYVSYSMNRGLPLDFYGYGSYREGLLVRTAKHDKDYTGGMNTFVSFNGLINHIQKLIVSQAA